MMTYSFELRSYLIKKNIKKAVLYFKQLIIFTDFEAIGYSQSYIRTSSGILYC